MPMNINPMQLIQMIKGGQNPQQLVMNMLEILQWELIYCL